MMGGMPSNAALVGANTVNGPGSVRSMTRPDNLRAATNVEKIGLLARRSRRVQPGTQWWGTDTTRLGGDTGLGRWLRLGRFNG